MNPQDPIVFIPLAVDTTGRMYDELIHFLFFHTHREVSDQRNRTSFTFFENCQRNRTSFISFSLRVSLIEGYGRFCNDERIGYTDFNTFGPFFSVFHTDSDLHSFASSHTVFKFYPLPSYFFLLVLPKWHMLSVYFSLSLDSLLIIDLVWHFSFPWTSSFFILMEINLSIVCICVDPSVYVSIQRSKDHNSFSSASAIDQWPVPLPPRGVLLRLNQKSSISSIRLSHYGLFWILMTHLWCPDHTLTLHTRKPLVY